MAEVAWDAKPRSLALAIGRVSKSAFLANLLNPAAHNMRHFRVGSAMCPGKRGCDWRAGDLARCGRVSLLRVRLSRIVAGTGREAISVQECNSEDARNPARNGDLDVIRELRAHGIHCTASGADSAAGKGRMDVVRELRAHTIPCTSRGADWAAQNGHVAVIQDLRTHCIN